MKIRSKIVNKVVLIGHLPHTVFSQLRVTVLYAQIIHYKLGLKGQINTYGAFGGESGLTPQLDSTIQSDAQIKVTFRATNCIQTADTYYRPCQQLGFKTLNVSVLLEINFCRVLKK
jgi:hypothetical protein